MSNKGGHMPAIDDFFKDYTEELDSSKEREELVLPSEIEDEVESRENERAELLKRYEEYDWGAPLDVDGHLDSFNDSGWVGRFHMEQVLSYAVAVGASDIHLTAYQEVSFSILGEIVKQPQFTVPNEYVMSDLVTNIIDNQESSIYANQLNLDKSYTMVQGPFLGTRFRASIGLSYGVDFITFRVINDDIPTTDEVHLEDEIMNWTKYPNGLFMICGSTGTGKSTTLASMINEINHNEKKKIITIENPIEYIYPTGGTSLIVQREVGEDVNDFYSGLTAAMRQAPDIIMLGEVRDNEEVSELIRAAETGHLAISTMHTNSVPTTLNRIQSLFDGSEQRRIMSTLADSLRGLANQVLVRDGKGGRFAVREILTVNDEIREMVAAGDVAGVRTYMRENKMTMEYNLARAAHLGYCTYDEAIKHTAFPDEFIRVYNEMEED